MSPSRSLDAFLADPAAFVVALGTAAIPRAIPDILTDLRQVRAAQDSAVVTPRADPFAGGSLFTPLDRRGAELERELDAAFAAATGMTLATFEEARS